MLLATTDGLQPVRQNDCRFPPTPRDEVNGYANGGQMNCEDSNRRMFGPVSDGDGAGVLRGDSDGDGACSLRGTPAPGATKESSQQIDCRTEV
ncbi:hypothetical protein M758_UG315800 [Ceratodon purpureus]|nr:hypothetical protein M758_UG315800 [Ceratodon purpureus]